MSAPAGVEPRQRVVAAMHLIRHHIGAEVRTEWAPVTDWSAIARFPDGRELDVTHGRTAADALEGLAGRLFENAICHHCARIVVLAGLHDVLAALLEAPCRWQRHGARWVSPHDD